MPSIFTSSAGTVMAIDATPNGGAPSTPITILLDSDTPAGVGSSSVGQLGGIITSFVSTGDTNTQFMHTLRDVIYLTVFGDKIGSLSIGGYLFLNNPITCGPDKTAGAPLELFYDFFYNKYVVKKKEPLSIAVGSRVLKGFLLSFQIQMADPQFMLGQFTLQMALLPGDGK
jgi:hypothetical protein